MAPTVAAAPAAADLAERGAAPGFLDALLPRRDATGLAVTAAVGAVALTTAFLLAPRAAALPALTGLALLSTLVAVGDAFTGHIANKLNVVSFVASWPLLAVAAAGIDGASLGRASAGAGAALALYGLLWLVAPGAMGLGDVKFSPTLGAHLALWDWDCWLWGLVAGMVAQAGIVLIGMALGRLGRSSHVPHGPAMCLGTMVSLAITLRGA